jgi:competence protein ComEA
MWRHFVSSYFSFSRKERKGVIAILSIVTILMLISFALPVIIRPAQFSHSEFEHEIAQLNMQPADSAITFRHNGGFSAHAPRNAPYGQQAYNDPVSGSVFYFDPNTISASDWKKLGLRDKTIATIQKYISKGGRFYKPQDIAKIWGLSPRDQQRLIPYVSIATPARQVTRFEKRDYPAAPQSSFKVRPPIDVNQADTSAYISLPGIGSRLAQRIVAFRDKLGGFHSVDQVGETYMLPDSTFQKIRPRLVIGDTLVKKININDASIDQMKSHPYLRYALANAIFQYRQQHGSFRSVDEIKKIMLVSGDIFYKIAPYLSVQ